MSETEYTRYLRELDAQLTIMQKLRMYLETAMVAVYVLAGVLVLINKMI